MRRPRDTPLWKLEASLKCRSCRKGRHAPSVHMIKLTERQEITPYKWVHPREEPFEGHCSQLGLASIARLLELMELERIASSLKRQMETAMSFGKGALLWLIGIPLPIILLLAVFMHH
jgi:hypothetical protein